MRVGRVFWVEHEDGADDAGFPPDGRYKVVCRTPWGDVHLWPYEYVVEQPELLTELWAAGELAFHPMAASDRQFSEVLFFAMARGIPRGDAVAMALGTMSGPVGWFEPATQELAEACEALADRVNRWPPLGPENHARRAAARRRRKQGGRV